MTGYRLSKDLRLMLAAVFVGYHKMYA